MASRRKSPRNLIWTISIAAALSVLVGGGLLVKMLIGGDSQRRQRQIQTVTLLKPPPPPPPPPERPPEPEKKEELIEEKDEIPEEAPEQADETPPGEELGLDADGSAGSDAFGLKAKKGGRALIGGGLSKNALLQKYAWYNQLVEREIHRSVNQILDQNGGMPKGNYKAIIELYLDAAGNIVRWAVAKSSGNDKVDDAVKEALQITQIEEPPPEGMPEGMKIRMSFKG